MSVCVWVGGRSHVRLNRRGEEWGQPDANNGIYAAPAFFGLHVGI